MLVYVFRRSNSFLTHRSGYFARLTCPNLFLSMWFSLPAHGYPVHLRVTVLGSVGSSRLPTSRALILAELSTLKYALTETGCGGHYVALRFDGRVLREPL